MSRRGLTVCKRKVNCVNIYKSGYVMYIPQKRMMRMKFIDILPYIIIGALSGFFLFRKISSARNLISYRELKEKMESGESFHLIDVRTGKEFRAGHIRGSVNVPQEKIPSAMKKKIKKDSLIVVYCHSGSRAALARRKLLLNGYSNVVSFGSIRRWKDALVS